MRPASIPVLCPIHGTRSVERMSTMVSLAKVSTIGSYTDSNIVLKIVL